MSFGPLPINTVGSAATIPLESPIPPASESAGSTDWFGRLGNFFGSVGNTIAAVWRSINAPAYPEPSPPGSPYSAQPAPTVQESPLPVLILLGIVLYVFLRR